MFGRKKTTPQIDKEQLELIQNAQKRIRQKKRLFLHFVFFLVGSVIFIIANTLLGIAQEFKIFGAEWFVFAILVWLFLFLVHLFNVYVTNQFMGKEWEQAQLNKLLAQQQARIDRMKSQLIKEENLMAQAEAYSEVKAAQKNPTNSRNNILTIIVAAGENDAIGINNKLIWHLSDDLKRFKKLTSGHHIIMGRKTFESFPKPLPNRIHVVITRQENYRAPNGVIVVNSLNEAIEVSKSDDQPFIIGGGEIYKQAIPIAEKLEITRVHHNFEADTFFPIIDKTIWKEVSNTFHEKDENHEFSFSFITYIRH
jgi:dihydrofolate reductase